MTSHAPAPPSRSVSHVTRGTGGGSRGTFHGRVLVTDVLLLRDCACVTGLPEVYATDDQLWTIQATSESTFILGLVHRDVDVFAL